MSHSIQSFIRRSVVITWGIIAYLLTLVILALFYRFNSVDPLDADKHFWIKCIPFLCSVGWIFFNVRIVRESKPAERCPDYETDPRLDLLLNEVCSQLNIQDVPDLEVAYTETLSASASGFFPGVTKIAISLPVKNKLDRAEIKAIFGHELGHLRHWDLFHRTTLSILITIFLSTMCTTLLTHVVAYPSSESIQLGASVFVLWTIHCMALYAISNYNDEHRADMWSVVAVNSPEPIVNVLTYLERVQVRNSLFHSRKLFLQHPPLRDRIKTIRTLKFIPDFDTIPFS